MESKGRRTPRMTARVPTPTSRTMSEPEDSPKSQGAAEPTDPLRLRPVSDPAAPPMPQAMSDLPDPPMPQAMSEATDPAIPQRMSEPADPEKISTPAEEPILPPEFVVERVLPPIPAPLLLAMPATEPRAEAERHILAMIDESRAALASGVESINDQLASFTRQSMEAIAHTAIQMLRIRTWADAVAVNTSFARTSYGHWLDSAAKVSELGVKLALDSSKPFVSNINKAWSGGHSSR